MKKITVLLAAIIPFTACAERAPQAKVLPAVTTAYTDVQIDSLISAFYLGQDKDVRPSQEAGSRFLNDFPGAAEVEWSVSNNVYEADFDIARLDYEAWYDASGNLLMYKYDVSASKLPAAVKSQAKQKYPGYRIEGAETIRKGTATAYKVSLEKKETDIEAYYSPDGTFLGEQIDW